MVLFVYPSSFGHKDVFSLCFYLFRSVYFGSFNSLLSLFVILTAVDHTNWWIIYARFAYYLVIWVIPSCTFYFACCLFAFYSYSWLLQNIIIFANTVSSFFFFFVILMCMIWVRGAAWVAISWNVVLRILYVY